MAILDIQVFKNSTDITSNVLGYVREGSICSSIFTGDLTLADDTNNIELWDRIVVYEYGIKRVTFLVQTKLVDRNTGEVRLTLQDYSKKLSDYLITDIYNTENTLYSTKYWLELFLDEAKVSYTFGDVDDGAVVSNYTSMGMQMAYDQVMTLLQQNGWYMYFDANGTAQIGVLSKTDKTKWDINDDVILSINRSMDDSILRNRAVVWGSTSINGEVYADRRVRTPWQIDSADSRAVVLANSNIYTQSHADQLAKKMLDAFASVKDEKTVQYVNDPGINLGDTVKVNSRFGAYKGLVTDVSVTASADGLIYSITLDRRCPRLFTYFGLPGVVPSGWVYTGHWGDGIWRKQFDGQIWYDYSTGLENLFVKDLAIKDGIMACVVDDGHLYVREEDDASWSRYDHPDLNDEGPITYSADQIGADCCSINDSGFIVAGYNLRGPGTDIPGTAFEHGDDIATKAWVLELDYNKVLLKAHHVTYGEYNKLNVYDLEGGYDFNIVALSGVYPSGMSSEIAAEASAYLHYSSLHGYITDSLCIPDPKWSSPNLPFGDTARSIQGSYSRPSSPITWGDHVYIFTQGLHDDDDCAIYDVNTSDFSDTTYIFSPPPQWNHDAADLSVTARYLTRLSDTSFVITIIIRHGTDPYTYSVETANYIAGATSIPIANTIFDSSTYMSSSEFEGSNNNLLINNTLYMQLSGDSKVWAITCNILSGYSTCTDYTTAFSSEYSIESGGENFVTNLGVMRAVIGYKYLGTNYFKDCAHDVDAPTSVGIYLITDTVGSIFLYQIDTLEDSLEVDWMFYFQQPGVSSYSSSSNFLNVKITHNGDWQCGMFGNTPNISYPKYYQFSINGSMYGASTNLLSITDDNSDVISNYAVQCHSNAGTPVFANTDVGVTYINQYGAEVSWLDVNQYNASFHKHFGNVSYYTDTDGALFSFPAGRSIEDFDGIHLKIDIITNYCMAVMNWLGNGNSPTTVWLCQVAPSIDWGTSAILKETSVYTVASASTLATDTSGGLFELIYDTPATCKVEIPLYSPTIVYSTSYILQLPGELAVSTENTFGSFITPSEPTISFCVKTEDLLYPSSYTVASGILEDTGTGENQRFLIDASKDYLLMNHWDFTTNWAGLVYSYGLLSQVETTNFMLPDQYVFFTVSGVKVGETLAPIFFQKFPTDYVPLYSGSFHLEYIVPSGWYDYSEGLPTTDITIIRTDDFL